MKWKSHEHSILTHFFPYVWLKVLAPYLASSPLLKCTPVGQTKTPSNWDKKKLFWLFIVIVKMFVNENENGKKVNCYLLRFEVIMFAERSEKNKVWMEKITKTIIWKISRRILVVTLSSVWSHALELDFKLKFLFALMMIWLWTILNWNNKNMEKAFKRSLSSLWISLPCQKRGGREVSLNLVKSLTKIVFLF